MKFNYSNIAPTFREKLILIFFVLSPLGIWVGIYHPFAKADDLARRYELNVENWGFNNAIALADFNGDGKNETIRKWPENSLVVEEGTKEILRLPYHHTDGSFKTHLALVTGGGAAPRLLQYDDGEGAGARRVYVWRDGGLSTTTVNQLDKEILYGLGIGEDRYFFRDIVMMLFSLGLLPYWLALVFWVWRKARKSQIAAKISPD